MVLPFMDFDGKFRMPNSILRVLNIEIGERGEGGNVILKILWLGVVVCLAHALYSSITNLFAR